VILLTSS